MALSMLGGLGGWSLVAEAGSARQAAALAATGKSIGLILSSNDFGLWTTPDGKTECPAGFVQSDFDNWQAQFPTREARQAHLNRCGGPENRGPNCENSVAVPDQINDPLPYRSVTGKLSYGINLDGTQDGRATAKTCTHEKFTHPDGTPAIDNQLYRLIGCLKVARSSTIGAQQDRGVFKVATQRKFRTLLEVRGVDSEVDDPSVEVWVFQGRDQVIVDLQDIAVPWQALRADPTVPPRLLRGRIEKGVVITEPADAYWEDVSFIGTDPAVLVKGTRLRLKLTPTGAQGIRAGYVDIDSWWNMRRMMRGWSLYNDSPPSLYRELRRLADGYRDAATGQCTGLSSATNLTFSRVSIQHDSASNAQMLASAMPGDRQ